MNLWLRLAFREILNGKRFAIFFSMSMAFGLAGFMTIDSVQSSVLASLTGRAKGILGGDLGIRASRPVSEEELAGVRKAIPGIIAESYQISLFSMASSRPAGSEEVPAKADPSQEGTRIARLVRVTAMDNQFPFYGELRVKRSDGSTDNIVAGQAGTNDLVNEQNVWVYPEVFPQLNVDFGAIIQIGEGQFRITGIIEEDASAAGAAFAVAPRVFIGMKFVDLTGLIQKGSRVEYRHIFKTDSEESTLQAVSNLGESSLPPEIRVITARSASEDLGRQIGYLNDYLGLVALVALFLASLGAAFLFRSHLASRTKDIGILMAVGATPSGARAVFIAQLALLGVLATAGAALLSVLIMPLMPSILGDLVPKDLTLAVRATSLLIGLAVGSIGAVLICLPELVRMRYLRPSLLFHDNATRPLGISFGEAIAYMPQVCVFWLLACFTANSWIVGTAFVGGFAGGAILLALVGTLLVRSLSLVGFVRSLPLRLALRNLGRSPTASVTAFLAIGLGATLINLIPQIRSTLLEDLAAEEGGILPALFLFDIQPEQVEPLKTMLKDSGTKLDDLSPLIRGRLLLINGQELTRMDLEEQTTREGEQASRARSRGMNLSYRSGLFRSETVEQGKFYDGPYDASKPDAGPPEVSLEFRFAERIDAKVGDVLTFDVQGIPVEGRVTSLRRVKWTSFQPNFFIQFQPGVLEEAPQTFVAAIPAGQDTAKLQGLLVEQFANVSIVDVSRTIERILSIVEKIAVIVNVMATGSLVSGLVVLFALANYQAQARRKDVNLLKVLGAKFADLRRSTAMEFGLLGGCAALFGTLTSLLVSYILSRVIFDTPWRPAWELPVSIAIVVTIASVATALLATLSVLRGKPRELLQSAG